MIERRRSTSPRKVIHRPRNEGQGPADCETYFATARICASESWPSNGGIAFLATRAQRQGDVARTGNRRKYGGEVTVDSDVVAERIDDARSSGWAPDREGARGASPARARLHEPGGGRAPRPLGAHDRIAPREHPAQARRPLSSRAHE